MADDYEQRKELAKEINTLSRPELEELYRILKREGGSYSENSNGIFFDIASLPASVFQALWKFLQFCKSNAKDLEERTNLINTMATGEQ
uniref:NET domain-containing protein n=1 Tax=viral metagenome TaxID=1070528 RepID=A0A6C0AMN9_9ZZZZ